MGICAEELRRFVIRPTLEQLGEWSEAAENLMLATAAQESGLGFHLKNRRGRSLGIYQVTPHTHTKIWDKYLVSNPDLASKVRGLASQHEFLAHPHAELATNLSYATAIAWMIYRRANKAIPSGENIQDLAKFWARHFHHRSSDPSLLEEFEKNYRKYVLADQTEVNNKGLAA